MTRLLRMLAVTASLFILSDMAAMAAGKSPQECAKLDREYPMLLQKEDVQSFYQFDAAVRHDRSRHRRQIISASAFPWKAIKSRRSASRHMI